MTGSRTVMTTSLPFCANDKFNSVLDRRLTDLPTAVRRQIDRERPKLAAASADIADAHGRQAIEESFVAGFRVVAWLAAALAAAGSLTAVLLIDDSPRGAAGKDPS